MEICNNILTQMNEDDEFKYFINNTDKDTQIDCDYWWWVLLLSAGLHKYTGILSLSGQIKKDSAAK